MFWELDKRINQNYSVFLRLLDRITQVGSNRLKYGAKIELLEQHREEWDVLSWEAIMGRLFQLANWRRLKAIIKFCGCMMICKDKKIQKNK